MRNCSSYEWNVYQVFLSVFHTFANRFRYFASFTDTSTNPAIAVTDNNQCAETKATSAFYNFSYTINIYNSFRQF
ncbi:hypothetical protein D1872_329260 [compost metagenome]